MILSSLLCRINCTLGLNLFVLIRAASLFSRTLTCEELYNILGYLFAHYIVKHIFFNHIMCS